MALHAKNLSFLFLLVLSTCLQIEARQSKFLTEAIHYHINKTSKTTQEIEESPSPAPSPLLAPTPELAPASTAEVEAPISPLLAPTPQLAPVTAEVEAPSPLLAPTPELAPASTAEVEAPSPLLAPTPQLAPATADQVEYGYGLYGYNSNSDTSTSTNENKGYSDIYDDRLYAAGSDNEINSNGGDRLYAAGSDNEINSNGENYDNYFQNGYQQMRGGEGYYGNNVESKYEFNTMEEYERQEEYANSHEDEYIP